MTELKKVATLTELAEVKMKSVAVGGDRVLLCYVDGKVFAVADECSHDSSPFGGGRIRGDEVICPRHGARFSVIDGSVKGPPAVAPIDTFVVKVEGDDIYVEVK